MDLATHAEIAAAKVAGAACIDALPDDRVPDTVVLYSSAAGVLGSGGQGGYAAANAYLDALAARWRARGRTALSVAWGLWSGASVGGHLERHGMLPLQPEAALAALGHALRGSEPSLVIADIDWHRFAPVYAMARRRPLLDEIPEVREALAAAAEAEGPSNDTAGENGTSLAGSLAGLATAERRRALLDLVRSRAASVLGYDDADDVEAERAFVDLGLDSVTAIELRNRLAAATGLRLAATLAFDYPNATALAGQLEAELVPQAAGTAELVLEEISHLETRMSELAADDTRHDQISARLTALLSSWEARRTAPDPDGAAENLSSATDDELFELVDRQLGISPNHGR
jgi:acyl carrier protein